MSFFGKRRLHLRMRVSKDTNSAGTARSEASLRQAQDTASNAETVLRFERLSQKAAYGAGGVPALLSLRHTPGIKPTEEGFISRFNIKEGRI